MEYICVLDCWWDMTWNVNVTIGSGKLILKIIVSYSPSYNAIHFLLPIFHFYYNEYKNQATFGTVSVSVSWSVLNYIAFHKKKLSASCIMSVICFSGNIHCSWVKLPLNKMYLLHTSDFATLCDCHAEIWLYCHSQELYILTEVIKRGRSRICLLALGCIGPSQNSWQLGGSVK